MTKLIPLSQHGYKYKGQFFTIVDDDMFDELSKYSWHVMHNHGNIYAARSVNTKTKMITILMHDQIINPRHGYIVDHINTHGLDNRRDNLRECTNRQNRANSKISPLNTTGFKGVVYHRASGKFQASIKVGGKRVHLGSFNTPEEAARQYDIKALEHFGSFARLNFPQEARE